MRRQAARPGGSARPSRDPARGWRRARRTSHVVRLQPRRRRRRARARPCGGSPGGVGRTIMKDSASAASAGAELVLRRFPWADLARRPLLPPPETLPDRWLQAAEEEEVELLPFRSPPREENGTGDPRRPRRGNGMRVAAGDGGGPGGQACARGCACCGGQGPANRLETSGLALARPECSSYRGEGQEAGGKSDATTRRGRPARRSGSSEGPAWRRRREPGGPWLSGAAAARQTQRSACIHAPHLPGARSSWRRWLADKGAKCSAQVQHGGEGCEGTQKE